MSEPTLQTALELLFQGVEQLQGVFATSKRKFTLDGRLVGDIGEVIAALVYDLDLDSVSLPGHDATTSDGIRRVQIKATFQNHLTFRTTPDYYIGLKLFPNGTWQEIFNGPGSIISEHYAARKGIGIKLLSFSIKKLSDLSCTVPAEQRIHSRTTFKN